MKTLRERDSEERDRGENRQLDNGIYRKSILLMFKKSKNILPQDHPSPYFPWGPCKQKVLHTYSCKSDNVPLHQMLYKGVRHYLGLGKKGTALAKHQNKTAKQQTTKALQTSSMNSRTELCICLDTSLACSKCLVSLRQWHSLNAQD